MNRQTYHAGHFPFIMVPPFTAKGLGWTSLAITAASFAMPSPESILAILTALGIGWGMIRKRNSDAAAESVLVLAKAEAEAYKIKDEAQKGSTLGQLEKATLELREANDHMAELRTEVEELRREVAEQKAYNLGWAQYTFSKYEHHAVKPEAECGLTGPVS